MDHCLVCRTRTTICEYISHKIVWHTCHAPTVNSTRKKVPPVLRKIANENGVLSVLTVFTCDIHICVLITCVDSCFYGITTVIVYIQLIDSRKIVHIRYQICYVLSLIWVQAYIKGTCIYKFCVTTGKRLNYLPLCAKESCSKLAEKLP